MRIACLGGGPGGLCFAISMKLRRPDAEVTLFERNRPDDTFGWGVVLSDQTLGNLAANDPVSAEAIRERFAYWDDVAVIHRGERVVSGGHGFCGIGRMRLLTILQARAAALGVEMRFGTEVASADALADDHDVVVACDGLNSRTRAAHADVFEPEGDLRACRFVWLGTRAKFDDAFTFIFEPTERGWLWAHAYQFDADTATFIVECSRATWEAYGFGAMSQQESIAVCERVFARHLGGHPLMSNAHHVRGSAWIGFPRVLCRRWHDGNIVLLGDAAATAHFSIGSGTKLAMESAIALAEHLHAAPTVAEAFAGYEAERKVEVLRLQSAALNSLEWFEGVERYLGFEPVQLAYAQLTRSQRISHEGLRRRDPDWLASAEAWFQRRAGGPDEARPPVLAPLRLGGLALPNRIVAAPRTGWDAADGMPGEVGRARLAAAAERGAGLVATGLLAVSPEGRMAPGSPGLWSDAQGRAWAGIVAGLGAAACCRIGHAGARAASEPGWDDPAPLASGGWGTVSASDVSWSRAHPAPRAARRADMDAAVAAFAAAARRAGEAGFAMLEIDAAHGGLLAAFLSPLTNRRADGYGGDVAGRLRLPVEVLRAARTAFPEGRPVAVRISAADWAEGGTTPEDAVAVARALAKAGADAIAVAAGGTLAGPRPPRGRLREVPLADRIRNEAGVPVIVGGVSDADQADAILLAGRADLVAVGRPLAEDPAWRRRLRGTGASPALAEAAG